jgi:phosphate transport system permease protein
MNSPGDPPPPDPKRFDVARGTLLLDRAMTHLIRFGGLAVIVAVFGIFVFILKEIIPLFSRADVVAGEVLPPVKDGPEVLGVDEWGEMPFLYAGGDIVSFVDAEGGGRREIAVPGLAGLEITAVAYDPVKQRVALGLKDGRVGSFRVVYVANFDAAGKRSLAPEIEEEPWFMPQTGAGEVRHLSYGDGGAVRVIAVVRGGDPETVSILRLGQKRSLVGQGKLGLLGETDVSADVGGKVVSVVASQNGSGVLVADESGTVSYFKTDATSVSLRQKFVPFEGRAPARIDYLFGGVSVAVTAPDGAQAIYSLVRPAEGDGERQFARIKEFGDIGEGVPIFAPSTRNKSFLTGAGGDLSIRHLTSGATRWEGRAPFEPVLAAIDGKSEHFFIAGSEGQIQRFSLHDRHPDAGWRAFFGRVWYEGGAEPVYQWQSTGGTDDFEPKLSLVPLIIGSLKGTLYALLFSVPIALLAALFSASFLPPATKRILKPAMEIMASLPSVVLGFLAGIWLAPLIEEKVPSILLLIIVLPLTALAAGWIWCRQPIQVRSRFENGREWLVLLPVLFATGWLAWSLGPALEKLVFVYHEPGTGRQIADFRLWWPQATGSTFDQRNSLVVGFMMGFAVIPVIFTIAEDALSNVPKTLTAAASALGASRWQVVRSIVIPVASPGIFSALMIGFGRAVGETMIVVMATGNTPVTEWNIFSGMRTLSANIAVELPEAAPGSTHYRTLFLGALVLFTLTFVLNTCAEVLRQRLREKNQIV